jgi:hypothetical protein
MTRNDHDIFLMIKLEWKFALMFCKYLMILNWLFISICSIFTSLICIAWIRMHVVIDSIIRRMISDFFCNEFLIFSNSICIFKSSLFSRIIFRIFFICNLFMIFLMIMIFRIFRSTSSIIKIVNFRTCFVVLKLIDLFATTI